MATMEDISKVTVIDNRMKEAIMWDYQEKRDMLKTIGYGAIGTYAIQLVESSDFYPIKNGEKSGTMLKHYLLLNEQLETDNVSYLNGKVVKSGKGKTSVGLKDKTLGDILEDFKVSCEYDSKKPVSHLPNWQALWRFACGLALNLVSERSKPGNMPAAKLDFAKLHWQENNPTMLRKLWENESAKSAKSAKAAKAAEPVEVKTESAEKVTA